ncbi:nucleotide-diphospho-sugar transferase [Diaporthe amygdali]|uniref:nucleotide-diphospho-sugar transferase n=1 Tax=Phomopsis amygdali TaxID=1214568 RepID=UPI0022FE92E9|nr:nucleotide-diphospho-sugar transferase [Diaporthe amygdali]KAJ0120409.1 nucleotide-diphospho-sugar transferase [Diaporthe amygdali]
MLIPTHNFAGQPMTPRNGTWLLQWSAQTRGVEADIEYMKASETAGMPAIVVEKIEPVTWDGEINKGTWETLAPWNLTAYD